MVIEWMEVRVEPGLRDHYLEQDRKIWTAGLAGEEGFLGKEVWLGEEGEVVLVIRWRSEEDWKAVPEERLKELESRFREAVPEYCWKLLKTRSYEVA